MKIKYLFNSIFIIFCFTYLVFSQEANISPEKKKLIAEIVAITKADKKVEASTQQFFLALNKLYPAIVEGIVKKRDDLDTSQKNDLKRKMLEKEDSFNQRLQEKLSKTIQAQDVLEATIYRSYDKYFSESELKEILAFYKTPTGQKLFEVAPAIAADILNLTKEFLTPKVLKIIEELGREDGKASN